MTYPTPVGRGRLLARRALLTLTTALVGTLAAPALAQTATEQAIYQNIDNNGVDLSNGSFNLALREGSIGAGAGAIELWRYGGSRVGTDNLTVRFKRSVQSGVATFNLIFGNRRETFSGPAGAASFASGQGSGATLIKIDASNYRYTAADGTVTLYGPPPWLTNAGNNGFCSPGQETACSLIATTITEPNGVVTTYEWDVGENCRQTGIDRYGEPIYTCAQFWRQRGQSNTLGYRVAFAFQQEANPTTGLPGTAWYTRASASFTNTRVSGPARTVGYSYPSSSVVQITDDGGRVWRITSNPSTGITAIKRPGANTDSTTVAYGANGVTSVTRDGVTTGYNRTVSGVSAIMTVTNALQQQTVVTSDLNIGRPTSVRIATGDTTTFQYDTLGRRTGEIAPESNSRSYGYDSRGNVTSMTAFTKPTANPQQALTTSFVYPASCANPVTCNLPTASTDARGGTTDYAYDPTHGGITSVTRPTAPNGVRPQTRYGYSAIGSSGVTMLTSVSECKTQASCAGTADERRTTIAHGDPNLLPTSVSIGSGDGVLTATTMSAYDYAGNLVSVDGPLAGTVDTTTMRYDAARRMVGVISADPDGAGPLKRRAQRKTYNADNQVTQAEAGTVTGTDDASWNAFSSLQQAGSTYDANGRKVRDDATAGGTTYAVTQYGYDALGRSDCTAQRMNPAAWASPPGACSLGTQGSDGPDRISQTLYDAAGRVRQVVSAVGTADASADMTRAFTTNGQMASQTDGNGNVTGYEYDGFDRLMVTRYPSPTTPGAVNQADYEQFGYDPNGNVTWRRLRDGQVLSYSYDALNRRTYDDNPNTNVAEVDVSYTYDNLGRLTHAGDQNGWFGGFDYDALGRVTRQYSNLSSNALQYDLAGRLTRQTWADGFLVTYEYDQTGAMTAVRENGGFVLASFGYDDLGRRVSLTRGDGTATSYGYDTGSRLTSLGLNLGGTAYDQTVTLGYNPAGQVKSRTGSNDAYAWTGHGNTDRGYGVNGLNQLTSAGSTGITHDGRGNITSAGGQSYAYNTRNQLYTNSAGQLFYRNPLGLLNHIIANGTVTNLDYVGTDLATEFSGNTGQVLRRYVHGPGADEPLVQYEGSGTADRRFVHADERGTVVAVTNASGNALAINTYDEYGRPGAGNLGRFQYTGQKWIAELGLYDYKARMYAPNLGRFMQTDPIGYADGMNMYGYVGGDPVNGSDPSGLCVGSRIGVSNGSICRADGGGSGSGSGGSSGGNGASKGGDSDRPTGEGVWQRPSGTWSHGSTSGTWTTDWVRVGAAFNFGDAGSMFGNSGGLQNVNDGSILESTRKGERGRAATNQGTPDPYKHMKPTPGKPGFGQVKDPQTGKLGGPKPWPTDPRLGSQSSNYTPLVALGAGVVIVGGIIFFPEFFIPGLVFGTLATQ